MAIAILIGLLCTTAFAQDQETVRSWLEDQLGRQPTIPSGVKVEMMHRLYEVGATRELLNQLERQVGDELNHPESNRLNRVRRQITHGPARRSATIWYLNPGVWRLDSYRDEGERHSVVSLGESRDALWTLSGSADEEGHGTPTNLFVDPTEPRSDATALASRLDLGNTLLNMMSGGLNVRGSGNVVSIDANNSSWSATLEIDDKRQVLNGGYVDNVPVVLGIQTGASKSPAAFIEYSGWMYREELDSLCASSLVWRDEQDRLTHEFLVESAEQVDASTVRKMAAVPRVDQSDPVYGEITLQYVRDRRPGSAVRMDRDAESGEFTVKKPPTSSAKWVRAALLTVFIVLLVWGLARLIKNR